MPINVSKHCKKYKISRGNYYNQMKKGFCRWPKFSNQNSVSNNNDKILKKRMQRAKAGAKSRGILFDISFSEIEILSKHCFYCGKNPVVKNTENSKNGYSYASGSGLDRFDNKKGYIVGNVVPCCSPCNLDKGTLSGKEYIAVISMRIKTFSD